MTHDGWEYSRNCEIPNNVALPDGLHRVAMRIEYDGSAYSGWQRQKHSISVQEKLEDALSKVADEAIEVVCAGRTDTGVHATSQIIHFDTRATRKERNWKLGCNSELPRDIAVGWTGFVVPQFHARFSARSRTYRYLIYNKDYRPALLSGGLTWCREKLDIDKMRVAAQYLIGKHDFSSFRAAGCAAHTPIRTVSDVRLSKYSDIVVFEISANAFLQHMVRNIIGLLIEIGRSELPSDHLQEILHAKDRTISAPTARPNGLYFVDVEYAEDFCIPKEEKGPAFLAAMRRK